MVCGTSKHTITKARANRRKGCVERREHGLIEYRRRISHANVNRESTRLVEGYLSAMTAGNPMSMTKKAHINACLGVTGEGGLLRYFRKHSRIHISRTSFKAMSKRWLLKMGYNGFDHRRVDHNCCPRCKLLLFRRDALIFRINITTAHLVEALSQTCVHESEPPLCGFETLLQERLASGIVRKAFRKLPPASLNSLEFYASQAIKQMLGPFPDELPM